MIYPKSVLGLRSKFIVDEERQKEIKNAIQRYFKTRKEIPYEWVEEYNELAKRHKKLIIPHYLLLKGNYLIGCSGDKSSKEDVLRVHPTATLKEVHGVCDCCKKCY